MDNHIPMDTFQVLTIWLFVFMLYLSWKVDRHEQRIGDLENRRTTLEYDDVTPMEAKN